MLPEAQQMNLLTAVSTPSVKTESSVNTTELQRLTEFFATIKIIDLQQVKVS